MERNSEALLMEHYSPFRKDSDHRSPRRCKNNDNKQQTHDDDDDDDSGTYSGGGRR
jgi:hypothetical protein